MKKLFITAFALVGFLITPGLAAEPEKEPTFLTVAEAGPDYLVQGEYLNDWGGAQVIALADDKFRLVTYKGGLPGAGWDEAEKTEMEGKREGNVIRFKPAREGWSYELADGSIAIKSDQGETYTMKKTERKSPTLGAKPPANAIVLFDGGSTDAWQNPHPDDRKLLAAGTKTKRNFTNFTMHAEFMLPFKPKGRGQGRGNSGVYFQDRYELQVLDSFGLKGQDNECGGLYSKVKPRINMCYPPLTWQTYDIEFKAAQFDDQGKKSKNAMVTVKHNGVLIHENQEINGPTGGGKAEGPSGGAIQLQGHGNPVYYRNIWVVER